MNMLKVIVLLACGWIGWAIYVGITGDYSFLSVLFGTLIGIPLGLGALRILRLG